MTTLKQSLVFLVSCTAGFFFPTVVSGQVRPKEMKVQAKRLKGE